MTGLTRETALKWLLVVLCLVPVALFAYLGSFSRMMGDDYAIFAGAARLSARHNFSMWWDQWDGSYSKIIFHDLIAPLGPELMPQVMPAIIIGLWLLGLAWIIAQVSSRIHLGSSRLLVALTLAALVLGATIYGFHTWESIYWYAASVDNTLPVGVLLVYLAAALAIAERLHSKATIAIVTFFGAAICFINAGFSEIHSLFQTAILTLLIAGNHVLFEGARKRRQLLLMVGGWIATVFSLLVQLNAPGVVIRMNDAAAIEGVEPMRSLPALLSGTLETTFNIFWHQQNIASFVLMMATGLLALHLLSKVRQWRVRPLLQVALLASVLPVLVLALPVGVGLYSIGVVYERTLVVPALTQVLAGLAWGLCLGCVIDRVCLLSPARARRIRGSAGAGAAIVAVSIIFGILSMQLRLIPKFASYARDWDARHVRIIRLRDSGAREIDVMPFSFDMTAFIAANGKPIGGSDTYFYGVDSIVEREI